MKAKVLTALALIASLAAAGQEAVQQRINTAFFDIIGPCNKVLQIADESSATGSLPDGSRIDFKCNDQTGCNITLVKDQQVVTDYYLGARVTNLSIYQYDFLSPKTTSLVLGYSTQQSGLIKQNMLVVLHFEKNQYVKIFSKQITTMKPALVRNLVIFETQATQGFAPNLYGYVYLVNKFYPFNGPARVDY